LGQALSTRPDILPTVYCQELAKLKALHVGLMTCLLYLHQRSATNLTFPLVWTNTYCSHPLYRESELIQENSLVEDCHSSYRRKDHLTHHLLQHQGKLFKCPIENCYREFSFQGNMKRHVKELHDEDNPSSNIFCQQCVCPESGCGKRQYGCRAMMLDTVAAVPGIVGGVPIHLRSLRKFQQGGGWIKALLKEAENERMHLMTMVELVQPKWYERLLVLAVQGVFFNTYFVLYVLSPKLAHRVVGYLEEEATLLYRITGSYPRMQLKDVITVICADEAQHPDVNHFASDIHCQGKELREAPALLGYHL
ncbi:hypothetical protein UlMin_032611, partial [Ulmus minor]